MRYRSRKPPAAWRGSPAEKVADLDKLTQRTVLYKGNAGEAALLYPQNANVAAAVALAGLGFDATEVELVADPDAPGNVHEIEAEGAAGRFAIHLQGKPSRSNPKTSALAAMSVARALAQRAGRRSSYDRHVPRIAAARRTWIECAHTNAFVGSPVERIEDLRFLRGRGEFVDDLTRENLLHAAILRSSRRARPHPRDRRQRGAGASRRARGHHREPRSAPDADDSAAAGVARRPSSHSSSRCIAHDKVRYVGEPIAVVLAESAAIAEDALEAIVLDIEPLPAVADRAAAAQRRRPAVRGGRHQSRAHASRRARRCRRRLHDRARMSAASASRSSAIPRCRWSRAACWPNGTPRAVG